MRSELQKSLETNVDVKQAYLGNLQIKDNEIKEVIDTVSSQHPGILVLNLDSNNLSDEGAVILAQCLKNFTQLQKVSLQFNNIGREGMFSLLKFNPKLSMFFHGNQISDVGVMASIKRDAQNSSNSM